MTNELRRGCSVVTNKLWKSSNRYDSSSSDESLSTVPVIELQPNVAGGRKMRRQTSENFEAAFAGGSVDPKKNEVSGTVEGQVEPEGAGPVLCKPHQKWVETQCEQALLRDTKHIESSEAWDEEF